MKKTLTVNLNNIVFHIDDDAYEMLQTYLHEIADHFQSEEEACDFLFQALVKEFGNAAGYKNSAHDP